MQTAQQKAAETRRNNLARQRERRHALLNDREAAINLCRTIRDDPGAENADRLHAMELLRELTRE